MSLCSPTPYAKWKVNTRSTQPFRIAGIEYHHSGNWKMTVSAHSSFSCSARTSEVSVPASKARPESRATFRGFDASGP